VTVNRAAIPSQHAISGPTAAIFEATNKNVSV